MKKIIAMVILSLIFWGIATVVGFTQTRVPTFIVVKDDRAASSGGWEGWGSVWPLREIYLSLYGKFCGSQFFLPVNLDVEYSDGTISNEEVQKLMSEGVYFLNVRVKHYKYSEVWTDWSTTSVNQTIAILTKKNSNLPEVRERKLVSNLELRLEVTVEKVVIIGTQPRLVPIYPLPGIGQSEFYRKESLVKESYLNVGGITTQSQGNPSGQIVSLIVGDIFKRIEGDWPSVLGKI